MSKNRKGQGLFEERADRLQKVESRRQREHDELRDEYDDVFSDDALGTDEFWIDEECTECVSTYGGDRFCTQLCENQDDDEES